MAFSYLNQAENFELTLNEQLNVYKLKILYESNKRNQFESNSVSYKYLENHFLKEIQSVSSLYSYFWTTLFLSNQGKNDQFTKINDCGSEIERKKY